MGEAIVFTSGKGGVGKTTAIANIGTGLSQLDKKVIMLDADMGLRNLDVVMGLEERIRYNLLDLLENKCRLKQALIKDKRFDNLYMIPASLKTGPLKDYIPALQILIESLKTEFDYILIDSPAGIEEGFWFSISAIDRAAVITTPSISAVRDAGRVIYLLESNDVHKIDLIINEYDSFLARRREMLSRDDIEEILDIRAIGTVSSDKKIIISQNRGIPAVALRSRAGREFFEISKRFNIAEEVSNEN